MFVSPQTFKRKRGNVFLRSIDLVTICWGLTGEHPKLLLAHTLSLSSSVLVAWVLILPNYFQSGILHALTGILWLLVLASLGILVGNAVLIVGAQRALEGHRPSLREGFRVALLRTPQIVGWAFVAGLVGTLIKVVENLIGRMSPLGGAVSGNAAGIGWGLIAYFVMPLMILEGHGPITALKNSSGLAGETWVKQILGDISLGLSFVLLAIPGLLCLLANPPVSIMLAVLYFVPLLITYGVTSAFYQIALYRFAITGEVPPQFDRIFAVESK